MKKKIAIAAAMFFAAVVIYGVIRLEIGGPEHQLARAIEKEASKAREAGTAVYLKEHTDFAWDKVYVFGPYTGPQTINAAVGYHWTDRYLSNDDANKIIVFCNKGKVVRHIVYSGPMSNNLYDRSLSREEAVIWP
ncbi:hypothetical protein C8Z91_09415 [Paenibacillus elgii]|uniref:Uncharacterized protein n=1 Tax=Paenibacillus elgii TaxID=189691 RepID=A0A2T6G652_9BACL|nr:hypothetical protein [Paenibacillus elgii]PUA39631.1 hypothetical protein C8Z91_09415 [Paenibacillus elgii]